MYSCGICVCALCKHCIINILTCISYVFTIEEIFIDYGYSYDRSSYGADSDGSITTSANDAAKAADLDRRMKAMAKLQKEIDDLTLQPIRDSSLTDDEKSKLSQDTTLTGGFIDKLRKQEVDSKTKKKQNKSGVITPEEGMARFNEIGSGMFSSSDDRDLIDSMLGKKSKKKGGSSRKRNSDDDDEDDDDEDLQESLGSGVSASTGSASKEELDMMDSLFGRKPSSGSIIDIAQTISSDPSTQSEKTSTQASRPTGTTRSIFEQSPSKFKSPEVEAQEVDDEIDNLLKSIKEKNKSKSRNGVSDDGSSSFVDDFAANSYLGALDLLSSEEDEEDDPNDYDYGDDVSVSVSVSKDIFPTSDTTITSKTSLTTSTTPSVTASSQPTQSQSKLQSDSSRNEAIANSGITKSSKMLKAEEELQKQLENMSDDEIKLMFRRIRENIARNNENSGGSQNSVIPVPPPSRGSAARAAAELDLFALNAKKQQQLPSSSSSTAGKGFGTESNANTANSSDTSNNSNVKYPKSQPSDPKVREKYKTELEQFESELENLYRDPLAVWQDMVMNPDILKDLEIPDNDGSGVSGGDDDSE